EPRKGAVMAFAGTRSMPMGHVAVVEKVLNDREILISHANWSPINGRRGQIERNVRVVDVSDAGDWSMVRVWYAPIGDLGLRANPVQGFIYPNGPSGAPGSFNAPVWAKNDWKPGNGLDLVAASLSNCCRKSTRCKRPPATGSASAFVALLRSPVLEPGLDLARKLDRHRLTKAILRLASSDAD